MIRAIRSVLCAFCFFIFGLGGLLIGSIVFPVVLLVYKPEKQQKIFANSIHVSWRIFMWLACFLRLIKINCPAHKQLKSLRGTIVIANHPSLIDVVILVSRIPNSICVVKESLFRNVFIRKVIGNTYLSNTMSPDEFIKRGTEVLAKGYNIVVFPEGTRTVAGRPVRFHRGFAYLHIASGAAILPIKITNTPPILGKQQKWWDIGSKTSVYDIEPKSYIYYDIKQANNNRIAAIAITEKSKNLLFCA